MGGIKDKMSLYADNILLYLEDAPFSLRAALCIIDELGIFFGFRVNWDKTLIFPLI